MADFLYPIRAVVDAVRVVLAASVSVEVEHHIGEKFDAALGRPPRYVWVPLRGRPDRESPQTPAVDQHRALFYMREHFHVGCWGRDLDEAWALAQNLVNAVQDQEAADVQPEGSAWERPGGAWNQKGELLVLEMSVRVPFIRAYVQLTETPDLEDVATVVPTVIEADMKQVDDLVSDGETALVVTTAPAP